MDDIRKLVSGLKSAVTALEAAVGVDKYADGKEFGNPVQDYDDDDVDMGGEGGERKKSFIAMQRRKLGDMD